MPTPFAIAAAAIKEMIDQEFAVEQITCIYDELHEALGSDDTGGSIAGVSLIRQVPAPGNRVAMHTLIQVQFFDGWDKEIDPTQEVDPRIIDGYHARLLNRIQSTTVTASGDHWFFQWEGTEYPRDPTGNKTRFVMQIRAWSNNSALIETGG
jgi:hypothetical protein